MRIGSWFGSGGGWAVLCGTLLSCVATPALACAAIVVPEPTTLSLIGGAMVALLVVRRMRGGN